MENLVFRHWVATQFSYYKTRSQRKTNFSAKQILTDKIDDLHKIAKALITYETLTGEEIENIINKNIYPADKQNLKVEDDKGSAMGALGLKPKIVH